MPRGLGWPRPGRFPVSLRYGPPLRPEADEDARGFSSRMHAAMARLMDEDGTTWWESIRREAQGATPPVSGPDGARWRRVWESTRPIADRRPSKVWSKP